MALEPIERVTIKLPKSVAAYFRSAFRHGERSKFVVEKILAHERAQKVKIIENEMRALRKTIKRV